MKSFSLMTVTIMISTLIVISITWQNNDKVLSTNSWQSMASPGKLSDAHAFLGSNCSACHTAVRGADPVKCALCHSNDKNILQKQPTAFHSSITECYGCHTEHKGVNGSITNMSHTSLSDIGMQSLQESKDQDSEKYHKLKELKYWLSSHKPPSHITNAKEALLDCFSCHQNDDQHFKLFGKSCIECHSTQKWNISEFRHPSDKSKDCSMCHQAPPSHYMMHFKMISQKVAGKSKAKVNQCYECHQDTSWIDIKGVGLYKHH